MSDDVVRAIEALMAEAAAQTERARLQLLAAGARPEDIAEIEAYMDRVADMIFDGAALPAPPNEALARIRAAMDAHEAKGVS